MRSAPLFYLLLPVSLAWTACGEAPNPPAGFIETARAKDAGSPHEAPDIPIKPDAALPNVEASPEASQDAVGSLPEVWTAPVDEALPCVHQLLEFDFDPSERGFTPSNGFWMMWLAFRAFDSEDSDTRAEFATLGFSRYKHVDAAQGLQAMVVGSDDMVWVSFRGSTEVEDYFSNARFALMDGAKLGVAGRLHNGFATAVLKSWDSVYDTISSFADKGQPIWLSGHSLGGAMALMTAVKLVGAGHDVAALYSFANPRLGDSAFAEDALARLHGRSYRVVNHLDLTPRLPPAAIAAEQAAQVLNFDPLEGWAEDVIRDLDYAHAGGLFLFDVGNHLEYLGENGDWEDRLFWRDRSEHVSSFVGLIEDNQVNFYRHEQATYLCKMQALRESNR